jgi:L,D-peptidoglycan transpeptidase YkuD (ErfK/YbiS/YcfS/YnhG family)
MIIQLKNKDTLIVDDFKLKCCIGKNGIKLNKREGDYSTPKGLFDLGILYFRKDRNYKPKIKVKSKIIKKNMGWCDDSTNKFYNKEVLMNNSTKCEKLFRKDNTYDLFLVVEYNTKKSLPHKGSAIFIHLTKNYKPTAGCIALKKKDFLILIKLIKKKTKIRIN